MTLKMKQELVQKHKLPEGWKWAKFNEVAVMKGRIGWRGLNTSDYTSKGPILLSVNNITQDFKLDISRATYITQKSYDESPEIMINDGDLLLSKSGTIGRTCIVHKVEHPMTVNAAINVIKVNNKLLNNKYLMYFYASSLGQKIFSKLAVGMAQKNMFQRDLNVMPILLPPLQVQKQIVAKLDAQMAQIEIMKKEAEKEKEASDEIFQSFLTKEILDNAKEWEKIKIENLCSLMTGGTPSKSVESYWDKGDINWLASGDVNKEIIYEVEGKITQEGMNNSNTKMIPINSILIALNGQGKTRGTVAVLKVESTCNQSLVAFIPKDNNQLDYKFLFYYLKASYQKLRNITGDNERSGLSMRILNNYLISIPKIKIQREIVKKIELFNNQQKNIKEQISQKLSAISLLPSSILNEVFGKYEIPNEKENGK